MVVKWTTTCAISAYHHSSCELESRSCGGIHDTTLCDTVFQWLVTSWWFYPCTLVSSTNKTDCHNIAEKNITLNPLPDPVPHVYWNVDCLWTYSYSNYSWNMIQKCWLWTYSYSDYSWNMIQKCWLWTYSYSDYSWNMIQKCWLFVNLLLF
jgi:hypothetical protein